MTLGLPERIEAKISPEPNSGCWLWTGGLRDKKDGYGGVGWEGKVWRSHKLVYTLLVHSVPDNMDLDHLCRNRICCNPDHLEPVTRKVNIHRGEGVARHKALQTHCKHGHEFNEANTYSYRGNRLCRPCHSKLTLAIYHRKRGNAQVSSS